MISVISDNCPLNQSAYSKFGGPGNVVLPSDDEVFLIYDYVHIVKNVRNNWITEATQNLSFEQNGKHYIADWNDIRRQYCDDKSSSLHLTKLLHTAVEPKNALWSECFIGVFNEKTVAGLKAGLIDAIKRTNLFVKMISDWFIIMNVKYVATLRT